MFDRIAQRYDLLNRLMSLGRDQSWRRRTVRSLVLRRGQRVLDLATGTADLALLAAEAAPDICVVGVDPSAGMLEVGRAKLVRRGADGRVRLQQGDAEALPFENHSFDACCIAFGIRNVPDRPRALAEMVRVTRRGGRIAILELTEPRGALSRFHVHHVVPRLGALLSGQREYRYLQRSIAAFPPPDAFAAMMGAAGLASVTATALTLGVCHLFAGEVPA